MAAALELREVVRAVAIGIGRGVGAVGRVQAVRIVEGFGRMLLGYCSLQVEVAGIGPANVNQRMLFPLVRMDRAESMIRRALPEIPWPSQPLLVTTMRVFICAVGAFGFLGWAMKEMPEAQKRGS